MVIDGWLLQLQKADKQLQPTGEVSQLAVRNVILATGGFAADRSLDGLLAEVEKDSGASPSLSTTNGPWATGDGIKLGSNKARWEHGSGLRCRPSKRGL